MSRRALVGTVASVVLLLVSPGTLGALTDSTLDTDTTLNPRDDTLLITDTDDGTVEDTTDTLDDTTSDDDGDDGTPILDDTTTATTDGTDDPLRTDLRTTDDDRVSGAADVAVDAATTVEARVRDRSPEAVVLDKIFGETAIGADTSMTMTTSSDADLIDVGPIYADTGRNDPVTCTNSQTTCSADYVAFGLMMPQHVDPDVRINNNPVAGERPVTGFSGIRFDLESNWYGTIDFAVADDAFSQVLFEVNGKHTGGGDWSPSGGMAYCGSASLDVPQSVAHINVYLMVADYSMSCPDTAATHGTVTLSL